MKRIEMRSWTARWAACTAAVVAMVVGSEAAKAQEKAEEQGLPKVLLIGDSIRLSYTSHVVKGLEGKAVVQSPKANGGDSSNVLKNLGAWLKDKPDVVHFNCGIHDVKKSKTTGKHQTSPEQYEANLREIVARIRKDTGAVVLFATSTPIDDPRAAKQRAERDYELLDASIQQYNAVALKVMAELNVPVDDLRSQIAPADGASRIGELIVPDGVHLTPAGQALLGAAASKFIADHLPK